MTRGVWAVLVSSTVLAAPSQAMAGYTTTIVGRVTEIRADHGVSNTDETAETLVIKTRRQGEVPVSVGSRTRYVKWVTRQPWQQNTHADASCLEIGRLVAVEVGDDSPVARVVWIATD